MSKAITTRELGGVGLIRFKVAKRNDADRRSAVDMIEAAIETARRRLASIETDIELAEIEADLAKVKGG